MASSARLRTGPGSAVRPRLVRSGLAIGGAVAVASALTALSQLLLARLLDPGAYAGAVTLFIVITVAGVPLAGLQATVARDTASAQDTDGDEGVGVSVRAVAGGVVRLVVPLLAAILVLAALTGLVKGPSYAAITVGAGASIALLLCVSAALGALQGAHRFGAYSLGQIGFALLKLVLAVSAAAVGAGLAGIAVALAAATAAAVVLTSVPLRRYVAAPAATVGERRPVVTRYTASASGALTVFAILTTTDVVAARLSLTDAAAGSYAAASVLGRGLLLVAVAVATVLFPRVATLRDRESERRHLARGAAVTAVVCAGATLVFWLLAGRILRTFFGSAYDAAASSLGLLAAAMSLYAVGYIYIFHALSVARTRVNALLLPVLALQLAALAFWHDSARQLALVQLATAALLALGAEVVDRRST